jgi:NTP pyrophosphatase (non-canonical NTP hydrolase)
MDKNIEYILNFYGHQKQKIKVIEELAELTKAICKNDIENINEELADVEIMLQQLKIIFDIDQNKIEKLKQDKIERTLNKIKEKNIFKELI